MRGDLRAAGALCAVLALACGCDSLPDLVSFGEERPVRRVLETDPVTLVTSRFHHPPPSYFTRHATQTFVLHFDPEIVELASVRSLSLWAQDRPGGPWRRLRKIGIEQLPLEYTFPEDGAYGLRASATLKTGQEVRVPERGEPPIVWLWVDRQPPRLHWIEPQEDARFERGARVPLRFGVSEMEFGDRELDVAYSLDGGETWISIVHEAARAGEWSRVWKTPEIVPSECQLRISAVDMVGHRSELLRRIRFPSPGLDVAPQLTSQRAAPRGDIAAVAADDDASRGESLPEPLVLGPEQASGARAQPAAAHGDASAGAPSPSASTQSAESARDSAIAVEPHVIGPPPAPETSRAGVRSPASGGDAKPRITPLNLSAAQPLRAGVERYLFFRVAGLEKSTATVRLLWRDAPHEPYRAQGPPVPAAAGKILWRTPPRSLEAGALRLVATDASEREAVFESSQPLVVDAEPPAATVRAFQRREDGSLAALLDVADRGGAGLARVVLYVTTDGGATWSEREVEDPAAPQRLPPADGEIGLSVRAIDRAGWDTGAPQSGAPPEKTIQPSPVGELRIAPPPAPVLRGGEEVTWSWTYRGDLPAGTKARLEISPSGVRDWTPLAEAPLGAGRALVVLPRRDGESYAMRLQLKLSDGTFLKSQTDRFALDATPPQWVLGDVPQVASQELELPLEVVDPGAAELAGFRLHLRERGESQWTPVPAQRLGRDPSSPRLDLRSQPEGAYELAIEAWDGVGNRTGVPTEGTRPVATFRVDKTPPAVMVQPTALPWVEGLETAIVLDVDRADVVAPLVLEGRDPASGWSEIHRWDGLPAEGDLLRFGLPAGVSEYSVRISVSDRVGNRSRAVLGPRPVAAAVELASFDDGGEFRAGSTESVRWKLHAACGELADELRVAVSHQSEPGASWKQICQGLQAGGTCAWTLPASPGAAHRIRVSVFRRGELVGAATSRVPFSIVPASATPTPPPPTGKHQQYAREDLERAEVQLSKLIELTREYNAFYAEVTEGLRRDAGGAVLAEEQNKIPIQAQSQLMALRKRLEGASDSVRKNFERAHRYDPSDPRPVYGLARLERILHPDEPARAVKWLKKTVEIDPSHVRALGDLGASYIQLSLYSDAQRVLTRAYTIVRREDRLGAHPDLLFNLGQALYFQKEYARARPYFLALIEHGSSRVPRPRLCYYFIATYVQEGDLEQARELYELYEPYMTAQFKEPLRQALRL